MVRYFVPTLLACVYLAGSVWLVRNEGQAFRESLRRGKSTAGRDADASPRPEADPAPEPARRAPEPVPAKTTPAPEAPGAAKRAEQEPAPPPATDAAPTLKATPAAPPRPAPPPREVAPPPVPPASPPREAAPAAPPQVTIQQPPDGRTAEVLRWKEDPFWGRPHLMKAWDLDHLSGEEERQLGEQFHSLILELNPVDRDADLRRVHEAGRPLLDRIGRKGDDYRFFVLGSGAVNAFSHPGGYIYVSRKLLDLIPEDEPYLLEFVLAHEIAHVELRHALACLRDPGVRKFADGTLQKLYFLIVPYGYPDTLEFAADAWAYQHMRQLQRSEHDCLSFLRILDRYAKAHDFVNGRGKPEELLKGRGGEAGRPGGFSPIDNHLRSHPAAYDRLDRLKAISRQDARSPR